MLGVSQACISLWAWSPESGREGREGGKERGKGRGVCVWYEKEKQRRDEEKKDRVWGGRKEDGRGKMSQTESPMQWLLANAQWISEEGWGRKEKCRQRILLEERAKKGNRLGQEELGGGEVISRPCWRELRPEQTCVVHGMTLSSRLPLFVYRGRLESYHGDQCSLLCPLLRLSEHCHLATSMQNALEGRPPPERATPVRGDRGHTTEPRRELVTHGPSALSPSVPASGVASWVCSKPDSTLQMCPRASLASATWK